ncbi:monoamine oxidase [Rhodopseudomonas rhenobacensis]|uniref:Tryptophan 2-monooxygenase n=1 Tax=Rhodopseudomonas rhenobacensis TaxID=87461 RepID=A0A7W8DX02_9BRAD|nr:NAD(P)/FAD-dependent oxidoreductase [Rhodopseudomonas rhenobacensis]MBB5045393.1 monoamine oxidase [Rhodopseudomonas rhenobacensis]
MSLPSEVDIAIIGAGAAGLGAAHALQGSGRSVLLLEARDRIGGRAHTILAAPNIPFDVGCEWLHSADRNSFVGIATKLGAAIDRSRASWREHAFDVGFSARDHAAYYAAQDAFYERVEAAADLPQDSAAADWLEPGNPWNPLIDAISTYINGCELDQVSCFDTAAYEDSDINWRLQAGYGALITAYGAPCPVALNAEVTLIDHSGPRVKLVTSQGTLSAERVIVTVPTNLIADEAIRFAPALPDKVEAARGLPLGVAEKVMLALDEPSQAHHGLPVDGHLRGATNRVGTGSYNLRPYGRPVISGFFGGRFARELIEQGGDALAQAAIDELVGLLGADYRKRLRPLAQSRWLHDPFARGSYSHALPGHADARAVLAAAVDDRLLFAGEATSPHAFSTAHGARDSGARAAREAIG